MKISNAKKIIVSSLAIAMGAGLAGSVSGSVAWYQYSTRTSASIAGTSAGTVRELLIATEAEGTYSQHVSIAAQNFKPTSVSINNNALTFYEHPVYKTAALPVLQNTTGYVAEYNFYFKCNDEVNGAAAAQQEKDVYLSYINIVDVSGQNDTLDISPAVRVAIGNEVLSLAGGDTATKGNLNLNGNLDNQQHDILDKDGWDTNDQAGNLVNYINGTSESYTTTKVTNSTTVVNTSNPYTFTTKDSTELATKVLTTTKASGASEPVTVKVWLEGWESLGGGSLWTKEWLAQNFEIQLQFACQADR